VVTDIEAYRQSAQFVRGITADNAAADIKDRTPGRIDDIRRFFNLFMLPSTVGL